MKIETHTVEVIDQPGVFCIPGVHNMQITLCGFVDVSSYTTHDCETHPCNCHGCIAALRKIKAMKFPTYYFSANSRK